MPVKGRETHRNARRNCRAGAPKRANHALLSPPYSLLATCPIRGSSPPQATHGAIAVRARPSAPTTHCFLLPTLYSLLKKYSCPFVSIRGSIICPFVVFVVFVVSFLNVRTAQLPCGRARARQPRTTFYPLLPTLLKKIFVVHSCPFVVLLSALSWFSWFSWFPSSMYARQFLPCSTEAHCIVSTHYFLPSPPYSLLALCYTKCLDCNLLNPCPPPFISKHTAAR